MPRVLSPRSSLMTVFLHLSALMSTRCDPSSPEASTEETSAMVKEPSFANVNQSYSIPFIKSFWYS